MHTDGTMKRIQVVALWFIGVSALLSGDAVADHCPEDRVAKVTPETSLAGFDFNRQSLDYLLTTFGKPTDAADGRDGDYPPGSGWASYEWRDGQMVITAKSEFYTSESRQRVESIEVVEVSGQQSGRVPGTGRGLRLGDQLERVAALYGAVYVEGTVNGPELGERTITYCFSDETELSIGFDRAGQVRALRLAPSVE